MSDEDTTLRKIGDNLGFPSEVLDAIVPRPSADATPEVEDPITEQQEDIAKLTKLIGVVLDRILLNIQEVSQNLAAPGLLRDSASVRFFSLFSQLRDQVKQIDAAIGEEIDTESVAKDRKHDVGRLQGMVQRHLERIGAKNAQAEGKLVMWTRKLWASATDIAALKKCELTSPFVKEKVNPQTLTAWVKELDKDELGMPLLPDELKDAIKVSDTFTISARKS